MGLLEDLGNLAKAARDKLAAAAKSQGPGGAAESVPCWYYTTDGKSRHGPVSFLELKRLARAGQLQPSHMIHQEGMAKWLPAKDATLLWAAPPAAVPAFAAPPPLPTDANEAWYYAVAGRQSGPAPIAELRNLTASGRLAAGDLVWKAGMAAWVPAASVHGLFPAPQLAPPLLPATAYSPEQPPAAEGDRVSGELNLAGREGWGRAALHIRLDEEEIGTKSWYEGIHHLLFETTVGHHTVTLQDGDSKYETKSCQVEFTRPGHYGLDFKTGWILTEFPTGLEVRYASAAARAVPVSEVRRKMLLGGWHCPEGSLEFTADGAAIFPDGSVGEFQFTGKGIHFLLTDGRAREFKVLSLSRGQLVIAEGKAATTFRRPRKGAAAPTADPEDPEPEADDEVMTDGVAEGEPDGSADTPRASGASSTSGKPSVGGVLGGFWNWFSGKDKCPRCGSRDTRRLRTSPVDCRQEVRSDYMAALQQNAQTPPQAVFNITRYEAESQCNACKQPWEFVYTDAQRA